ncbi:ferric reductase-like transmembrane domain-containing protein [Roseinatronobacter alkalisoli]|uniref:Ferric reductase-like transmembrane domain-containing protein n=1 Tax=Roseinatronobacter alkalisoli TaxID=3028235 RepID=A0ABT5T897_9RHOB|nr:ferric reductase-like transmembrane domain-containing protein [Roseinatronobacter sp. HJB301]MDD7971350.1 ferric reductase-like transmembrane domain-containing protein [Roseinatronobacter sp. HJB301]
MLRPEPDPDQDSGKNSTATAQAHQSPHDRPWAVVLHAGAVFGLGILALGLPFAAILLMGEAVPSGGPSWDFSMGLGFGALAMVTLQFALTGRLRWITHPFGADIVYLAHRYLSWGALVLMGAHFALLYVFHEPALGQLNPLEARWELTAGRVALVCFAGLVITSQWRGALRLPYEWWRRLHLALAIIGFLAAIAHVLGVGNLADTPQKRVVWLGATLGWAGILLFTRLIRPWWQSRNPWRVIANHDEGGGVHRLELAPEGQALKRWKPGQFAWLKVERSPYALTEHPFTISAAPEHGPNLSFSIKALGDHSATLAQTQIGARAYVDGPYGAFSVDRMARAKGFVMIAGGVGITPILSNLHALDARDDPRPVILIYANPIWDKVAFRDELEVLRRRLNLTLVHVLEDPPDDWDGESGHIDFDMLTRQLAADTREWPHLLCGPGPMLAALRRDLHRLGVRERHIDYEIFELV